jgi:NADH-quinone oxidoreductase subunit E
MSGGKKFSEPVLKEMEAIAASYPVRKSAILPLLHLAQREFGFIDNEVVELVADVLGLKPIHVEEALSFYTMFHRSISGKYVIQVCTNLSCSLLGSEDIVSYLEKRLGIPRGSTTSDCLVTLRTVECLGSCGTAPAMMINDTYYENLSVEKVEAILRDIGA